MPKPILFALVAAVVAAFVRGDDGNYWVAFGICYSVLMIPMLVWVGIKSKREVDAYRRLLVAALAQPITVGPIEQTTAGIFTEQSIAEALARGAIKQASPGTGAYVLTDRARPVAEEWRTKLGGAT